MVQGVCDVRIRCAIKKSKYLSLVGPIVGRLVSSGTSVRAWSSFGFRKNAGMSLCGAVEHA